MQKWMAVGRQNYHLILFYFHFIFSQTPLPLLSLLSPPPPPPQLISPSSRSPSAAPSLILHPSWAPVMRFVVLCQDAAPLGWAAQFLPYLLYDLFLHPSPHPHPHPHPPASFLFSCWQSDCFIILAAGHNLQAVETAIKKKKKRLSKLFLSIST